jgi:dephospho-CoA kinase
VKPIIGIVGGIGSGKSLVAGELVKRGGYLISGDELGHEALRDEGIKAKVVERWGKELLDDRGEIQRRLLGRRVFGNLEDLRALEGMVFPYIGRRLAEEIDKARREPAATMIVVDAAVMMEAGWDRHCDNIIYVEAPRAVRQRRLREMRGWSEKEVADREKAQMPLEEKRRRADAIIDNSAQPERVGEQIDRLLQAWAVPS